MFVKPDFMDNAGHGGVVAQATRRHRIAQVLMPGDEASIGLSRMLPVFAIVIRFSRCSDLLQRQRRYRHVGDGCGADIRCGQTTDAVRQRARDPPA